MLAAIPFFLSLVCANIVPVVKRDDNPLLDNPLLAPLSIGEDIGSEIGKAIESVVHIPGVNNTDVFHELVSGIDNDLRNPQNALEELNPLYIGEVIQKNVEKLGQPFAGIRDQLIEAIDGAIEKVFGLKIIPAGPHVA